VCRPSRRSIIASPAASFLGVGLLISLFAAGARTSRVDALLHLDDDSYLRRHP
jgi:hypothetical protein